MKSKASLRAFLFGNPILAALLSSPAAFAGNTWDGDGGSGLWNTNANWNLDTAPSTGVALTFAGAVQNSTNNDLTADLSYAGINFTNTGADAGAFTLAGNSITLGGNITTIATALVSGGPLTVSDTISLDMILSGNRTITTNSNGSNTTQMIHNLTISGIISEDAAGRTLTKAGRGTLTLSGANSYSGLTLLSAGSLVLNGTNSSAGDTQLNSGLLILGTGTNNGLAGGTIFFNGGNFKGYIRSSDGEARSITNAISFVGCSTPDIGNDKAGNLSFTDTSTVRLSDTSGKTVTLTPSFSATTSTTFAQSFTDGLANGNLLKNGSGILILTGNSSYTGVTTILGGTLSINTIKDYGQNSAIGAPASGSLKLGNSRDTATLIYTGGVQSTNRTIQIGSNSGTAAVGDTGGALIQNNGSGALTFSAATFNTQTNAATGAGANRTLTLQGRNNGTISGIIQDNLVSDSATGTATVGVTKSGTGTWTLSGSNTFTGKTTLNAGTLKLDYSTNDNSKLADTTGILALNGGTLELFGGSHTEIVDSTTLNTGGTFIKRTGSASSLLQMGEITFSGGAIDFSAGSIATTTTGNDASGILANTVGIGRITVAGADFAKNDESGNIVAYTGYTTGYAGGVMAADTIYSLTASTSITTSQGEATNILKINPTAGQSIAISDGQTLTLGTILFTGANDFAINTTDTGTVSSTILLNYSSGNLTLGAMGTAITQYGTGKTSLSANATTDTGMSVFGGTVQFSNNLQIGTNDTAKVITLNNGTLIADTTGGSIALDNAGSNSRTVSLGAGGGTIDVIGGNTLAVSGVISGTSNPVTFGSASTSGTIILTATNTYTGATTISGGTLAVTGSLGATAVSVANAATLSGNGNIGGNVSIASGATHSLAVAATTGEQLTRAITGTLTLTAGNILNLTAAATPAAGVYVLATATTAITGTPTTINYNGITGTVSVDTTSSPKRLLLTVTAGTPYDTWANGAFANAFTDKLPGSNPDGDGLTNLLEFAFGTDPTVSSGGSIAWSGGAVTGHGTPVVIQESGIYYAVYGRRVDYATSGLTYTQQFSPRLSAWGNFATAPTVIATDGTIEAVKVPFPGLFDYGSGPEKATFFRMKVSQ